MVYRIYSLNSKQVSPHWPIIFFSKVMATSRYQSLFFAPHHLWSRVSNYISGVFGRSLFLPKYKKTSPKGFSASKGDVGNWIFSKLGTFWELFWIFCEDFFRRIFWEDFFGRTFLGGFFGRNSLFILLKSANLFESERDWCFCQDFVSIKKEGRRRRKEGQEI